MVSRKHRRANCSISVAFAFNLWFQRQAETGDVKPKPRQVCQQELKINDWEKFQAFVKTHGDKTQSEMAQLWDEEINQPTISRALGKIKQTRKKKHTAISKGTKPNEQPS